MPRVKLLLHRVMLLLVLSFTHPVNLIGVSGLTTDTGGASSVGTVVVVVVSGTVLVVVVSGTVVEVVVVVSGTVTVVVVVGHLTPGPQPHADAVGTLRANTATPPSNATFSLFIFYPYSLYALRIRSMYSFGLRSIVDHDGSHTSGLPAAIHCFAPPIPRLYEAT